MRRFKLQKKKSIHILTREDYSQVLFELGAELEFLTEEGGGAVILIQPSIKNGRAVMLTDTLCYDDPKDKMFLKELGKTLRDQDDWAVWDIFG